MCQFGVIRALARPGTHSLDADAQNVAVEIIREKGDFVISVLDDGTWTAPPLTRP
jgi:hypothetical protein